MIKTLILLMLLPLLYQDPEPVEVIYQASSTNRYMEIEYLDEEGELNRFFVIENDGGKWTKIVHIIPGRWSVAALGVKTVHGGVSCKLTIGGELYQKDRDTGKLPLSNCSGPVQ